MLFLRILLIGNLIKAECPFKQNINNETITIENFDNFTQLEFKKCKKPIEISDFGLNPNNKLILDNSLDFKGLKLIPKNKVYNIYLSNFKGFDLLSNPFKEINFLQSAMRYAKWNIHKSNLNFYINNKLLTENECSNSNQNWTNFITKNMLLELTISSTTKYSLKTCPFIFKNTMIYYLDLSTIKSSFIESNILTFIKIKNPNDLKSNIFQTSFKFYRIYFDDSLLNEAIFKNINILDINGILSGIQNDLFKSFSKMKLIRIRNQYVKQLFAKKNKWLEYLNFNLKPMDPGGNVEPFLNQSVHLIIYQSFSKVIFYDYPNEDFCLFSKFPHNKLVLPQLRPNHNSTCSCTEIYLIQYSSKHPFKGRVTTGYEMFQYYMDEIMIQKFSNCFNNPEELQVLIKKCNFKQRLNNCKIQFSVSDESYFQIYDWKELSLIGSLIFSVYLNPVFSLIVLFLNAITIKIIKSKSVLNEKNPMYKFIYINTIMCMLYIVIFLFKLIGICVDFEFYCSPISETKFKIYYKTIFILFFGETIKTASNFSFVSFSLSRFLKVTSSKSKLLVKLDKLKKRYYFLISILISVLINFYHIFEYNFDLAKIPDSFDGKYSVTSFFKYTNPSDEFIDNYSNFQYYLLNTFFCIKIIFSDLSYIVLNSIIDLKLLSFIKIQNSIKQRIISQTIVNISNSINQANSTTNRLTLMIVLNGLNCLIFRFPSAFASFYGFIFKYDKFEKIFKPSITGYMICRQFKFCTNLQEILYFLYLFSFILQFLIFLKCDKIFLKGYNEIKKNFFYLFKKNN